MSAEPVCVIGASGALGFGLAARWGAAGVPVVVGSREAGRARETVERLREVAPAAEFSGAGNADAATRAETVVLCVPFRSHAETLATLAPVLRDGQVIVDATVPLATAVSGRATRLISVWQGSAGQQTREMVPGGVGIVSALHTVSAARLAELDCALDEDVLVCGDSRTDKSSFIDLVERIDGLRGVDCGRLEMARITEALTPLLISINIPTKRMPGSV